MSLSKRIASIALIFTLLCLTSVLHAQNTTSPCSKLIEAFDQESLALKSSEDIQWMNFIAEKGFFVQKLEDKGQGFPDLLERNPDLTVDNINPFLLDILPSDQHQYFRIGDSGYIVIFYSLERLKVLHARELIQLKANLNP